MPPALPPQCFGYNHGVARHNVVGYHTADEIPNYWAYAQHFVLQDRMFAGVRSWSLPAHLDLTSEWVALCANDNDAATCQTVPTTGGKAPGPSTQYPWVNLFQLLDTHGISWKYYLAQGAEPDCEDDEMTCDPPIQTPGVPSIWNPAPYFKWVKAQGAAYLAQHNPPVDQFVVDAENGSLPQVSWVVPNWELSEHSPAGVTAGMEYVTSLVNAVMTSPQWSSSAIYITWDDWGGFYDHVMPPSTATARRRRSRGLACACPA